MIAIIQAYKFIEYLMEPSMKRVFVIVAASLFLFSCGSYKDAQWYAQKAQQQERKELEYAFYQAKQGDVDECRKLIKKYEQAVEKSKNKERVDIITENCVNSFRSIKSTNTFGMKKKFTGRDMSGFANYKRVKSFEKNDVAAFICEYTKDRIEALYYCKPFFGKEKTAKTEKKDIDCSKAGNPLACAMFTTKVDYPNLTLELSVSPVVRQRFNSELRKASVFEKFLLAILYDDTPEVEKYIDLGVDVNKKFIWNRYYRFPSSLVSKLDRSDRILNKKIRHKPKHPTYIELTPLWLAGDDRIRKLLLDAGADLEYVPSEYIITPIDPVYDNVKGYTKKIYLAQLEKFIALNESLLVATGSTKEDLINSLVYESNRERELKGEVETIAMNYFQEKRGSDKGKSKNTILKASSITESPNSKINVGDVVCKQGQIKYELIVRHSPLFSAKGTFEGIVENISNDNSKIKVTVTHTYTNNKSFLESANIGSIQGYPMMGSISSQPNTAQWDNAEFWNSCP